MVSKLHIDKAKLYAKILLVMFAVTFIPLALFFKGGIANEERSICEEFLLSNSELLFGERLTNRSIVALIVGDRSRTSLIGDRRQFGMCRFQVALENDKTRKVNVYWEHASEAIDISIVYKIEEPLPEGHQAIWKK